MDNSLSQTLAQNRFLMDEKNVSNSCLFSRQCEGSEVGSKGCETHVDPSHLLCQTILRLHEGIGFSMGLQKCQHIIMIMTSSWQTQMGHFGPQQAKSLLC